MTQHTDRYLAVRGIVRGCFYFALMAGIIMGAGLLEVATSRF